MIFFATQNNHIYVIKVLKLEQDNVFTIPLGKN